MIKYKCDDNKVGWGNNKPNGVITNEDGVI